MKVCITCKLPKSLDEFPNYKRYADGKHRVCRVCHNAASSKYRWAHGTTPVEPFLERLWNGVQICEHGYDCPFCCWTWLKTHDEDGYGKFSMTNAQKRHIMSPVTRIIYEIHHARPIPDGLLVCHWCDMAWCTNYHHFFLGTYNDNRQDCIRKGRHAKGDTAGSRLHPEAFPHGEEHYRAKLTEEDVHNIRDAARHGTTRQVLADQYGVSKFAINCVVNHKTWKHI